MGLFGLFNKKNKETLSIDEQRYISGLQELFEKLKKHYGGEEGYVNYELNELSISILNPNGESNIAVQISPMNPRTQEQGKPFDVLFDICRNGEGNPEEIKKTIQSKSQTVTFHDKTYSTQDIPWDNYKNRENLPCFTDHVAGEKGFWLFLPLPETRPFGDDKSFISVIDTCLELMTSIR
jgi:hypothetical protein